MPTTFRIPNIEIAIDDDDLAPLVVELDELGKSRFGEPAAELAQQIRRDDVVDVNQVTFAQFWPLLRALDHIRNAGTSSPTTRRLRDAMVAGGITYELQLADGAKATFFSYSGQYQEGDRLVAAAGAVVTVSHIEERENEPPRLLVH
jgi:hypothetical protein